LQQTAKGRSGKSLQKGSRKVFLLRLVSLEAFR
jgi:hypothetical protein